MGEFMSGSDEYLSKILEHECHSTSTPDTSCSCGAPSLFQCAACDVAPYFCSPCIVVQHTSLPCHRLQQWRGQHFEPTSLMDLGFVYAVGHNGEPCPHLPSSATPKRLTVVDTNGIHTLPVTYCHCAPLEAEDLKPIDHQDES